MQKRKRTPLFSLFLLILIPWVLLAGCTGGSAAPPDDSPGEDPQKLKVVATVFPAYDFVREIAGEQVELTMLLKPGAETHVYEPSPADINRIRDCDLFIHIGGGADPWVDVILSANSPDKLVVPMAANIPLLDSDPHDEDKDHDHDHSAENHLDEHVWTSPKNAAVIVEDIAAALCAADPENADLYSRNAAAYAEQLDALDGEFRALVDAAPRDLVVFGDRFPFRYLAEEYGLRYEAAFAGCDTDTEVSAAVMADLIDTVNREKLPYIYHIELSGRDIAVAICEETGAEMLLLHSCQNVSREELDSGATYLSLMTANLENLRKGLGA